MSCNDSSGDENEIPCQQGRVSRDRFAYWCREPAEEVDRGASKISDCRHMHQP